MPRRERDVDRIARDPEHLGLLRAAQPRSVMVIPQRALDRLVGMVVLAAHRPGRYRDAELALASEIAERVELVAENARLVRQREEFLSTAVHEIKTPIAVIKTAVQLLGELPPDRRELRLADLLDRLDRQCNRLNRLVTEVLEVSRIDMRRLALVRRATDLAALVERVVEEMRDVSPRHPLVLRRNDPVTAELDPDRIEQVLTNLVDNAIKYSPASGGIDIESRRDGDSVVVSVCDRGIGIPPDRQARIFERFYRAHTETPYAHASSLGVGLYLSREFVVRHGGELRFRSREGGGSCFSFRLPVGRVREGR